MLLQKYCLWLSMSFNVLLPVVVVDRRVTCKFFLIDVWNIKPHFHLSKRHFENSCKERENNQVEQTTGSQAKGLDETEQMPKSAAVSHDQIMSTLGLTSHKKSELTLVSCLAEPSIQ